ncbi:MAG: DegT/DnrJ/EryC1/StrS family aminotransferase, partial [Planctomycetes bacterium]|nr:DegT/DnrJ/EryC1/StrS family aminotransferase [Planctomycetota bacterium]
FGHAANMEALAGHARRRGIMLLEDCAHALGSRFGHRMLGTFGKAAIFSFSVLKLVTTFGGGMVTTDDDDLAEGIRRRLARMAAAGSGGGGWAKIVTGAMLDGGTRRLPFSLGCWPALRLMRAVRPDIQQRIMTETPTAPNRVRPAAPAGMHAFQAVLGSSQLARCEQFIARRRQVSAWLDEELARLPQVAVLRREPYGRHNGLYYGVLAECAAELSAHLFRRGIDSETSEYRNCADLELYREHQVDCPVAREVGDRILRLPNFGALLRDDVRRIAAAIRGFYARREEMSSSWRADVRPEVRRMEPA